ncbi:MarR family transcriptional regulator [Patulibacter brassicae]|uniref:MarR family transcriptional regulator n=1 Tax=Patulibacter brassicae TaxID=1705717 RepID=A0ABU4VS91_9ACTN|nr:MarR family transcriptional regulator [Patulibacter brassicae]MDX8153811.1 MarR family transcriptional regulator [Patulibacter brassicae]
MPDAPSRPALDAARAQAWRRLMFAVQGLDEVLERQVQRDGGMPHAYYKVLVVLDAAPDGELRMSEVCGRLHFSPSRLSHAVRRMEDDGWVSRRSDPDDGRAFLLRLTDEGRALVERISPRQVAEIRMPVMGALDDAQVEQLDAIAATILDAIDGLAADDC